MAGVTEFGPLKLVSGVVDSNTGDTLWAPTCSGGLPVRLCSILSVGALGPFLLALDCWQTWESESRIRDVFGLSLVPALDLFLREICDILRMAVAV